MSDDEIWISWCPFFKFEISSQVINIKVNKNSFKIKSNVSLQEPVSPAFSSCQVGIVKDNPSSQLSTWSAFITSSFRSWE